MKTILALCAAILLAGGVLLYRHMRLPDAFGSFSGAPKAEVSALIARPKDYLHKTVALEGEVREQCTAMGCFFFFHDGANMLRVDLQAVAMNAPRRNGHRAFVEGRMTPYGDGWQFSASAVKFE
ncbi:MAG: hypothetical protein HY077_12840 [Elusimicrobia bacterium]|nr:hypothetical protein [Elusimicrobiota bacterium]